MMKKLKILWFFLSFVTIIMLVFSNKIYFLWIGSEITVPLGVSFVMAAYVIIYAWCNIYSVFLNGVGIIGLQLYSAIFGSLINIPLSIYLGKTIGVAGVILSSTILLLISAIWAPIQFNKIVKNEARGIWSK